MRYSVLCHLILMLVACNSMYAQVDVSRRIPKPHNPVDSTQAPTNNPPSQPLVDIDWWTRHNQALLDIADQLVVRLYGKEKGAQIYRKLEEPQASLQSTTDSRTEAIKDFVDVLIRDYNELQVTKDDQKKQRKIEKK